MVSATLSDNRRTQSKGPGRGSFFVTDSPDQFIKVGARFLGDVVESAVRLERF